MHILLFSVQTYYELRKNASAQNEMWITLLLAADWRDCLKKKALTLRLALFHQSYHLNIQEGYSVGNSSSRSLPLF
jgi:hypothetical protein